MNKINTAQNIHDIERAIPTYPYFSINFKNLNFSSLEKNTKGNTFELRCPNATIEEIIWQNNINVFINMFLSSRRHIINEDFLNYKLKKYQLSKNNMLRYNEIFLKEALEFADLIFDYNKDKIYFLRQYLKNFQTSSQTNKVVLAKRFIR